jgi:hypothetical protein
MKPIQAHDTTFYDYWLLDEGILKIRITSRSRFVALAVSSGVTMVVARFLRPEATNPFVVLAFVWIVVAILGYYGRAKQLRKRLSLLPVEVIMKNQWQSTLYPWSVITAREFDGGVLKFQAAGQSHRAKIEKKDVNQAMQLARSRIGKLVVVG